MIYKGLLIEGSGPEHHNVVDRPDGSWYEDSTNFMIQRIKDGENEIDVINDLARQYAEHHSDDYAAFDFAYDALSRRAWEMDASNNEVTKTVPPKDTILSNHLKDEQDINEELKSNLNNKFKKAKALYEDLQGVVIEITGENNNIDYGSPVMLDNKIHFIIDKVTPYEVNVNSKLWNDVKNNDKKIINAFSNISSNDIMNHVHDHLMNTDNVYDDINQLVEGIRHNTTNNNNIKYYRVASI